HEAARDDLETLVRGAPVPGYRGVRFSEPAWRRLRAIWTARRPVARLRRGVWTRATRLDWEQVVDRFESLLMDAHVVSRLETPRSARGGLHGPWLRQRPTTPSVGHLA